MRPSGGRTHRKLQVCMMEVDEMNYISLRAEVAVQITKEDLDTILFEALNAGGIAGWADRVMAVGNILGKRVCEQVSNGGKIAIRGTDGTWYELDKAKLTAGIKQYIEESGHIRIEDERLALDDLTTNEADVIVQFALFGETKF